MKTSALPTVLLVFTGLCVGAKAADSSETVSPVAAKWLGWTELGGVYGSDSTSRGEATVFAPIKQTGQSLFFFEGTGNFFENDIQEGNFAVGYRQMLESGFNLGGWLGTDVRSTSLDNTFWQLSGGLEALSHDYDFRANFYVPLTGPKAGGAGFTRIKLQGNNIFMIGGQEVALGGVDAEVGIRIPLENFGTQISNMELRAYGGGFYFQDDDALDEIAGGKARVELRFPDIFEALPGSQLTAGYEFSYDDVRKDRHQAGLSLRIPFGSFGNRSGETGESYVVASLNPQERRMLDGLVRDTDIVTTQSGEEGVVDALTDVALHRVAYASSEPELQAAVGQGANTFILVSDGGAPIDLTATIGLTMQDNQTIQGGGSTIALRGANSGTIAGFTAPGSRPTLTSTVGSSGTGVLVLASNNHVAGLNIQGGYNGIFGDDGLDNMFIEQNRISGTSRDGIQIRTNNTHFAIFNNFIDTPGDDGIDIRDGNSGFAIFANTILNAEEDGIFLNHSNSNALISGNLITGSNDDAIDIRDFNRFVAVAQNTLTGAGENGIQVRNGNRFVLVAENTVSQTRENGIDFGVDNRDVAVVDNTVFDADDNGIRFVSDNSRIAVLGNRVLRTGVDGVSFGDNNQRILVAANTITDVGFDGIFFDTGNQRIFVSDNFVTRAGQDGISFGSQNGQIDVISNTVTDVGADGIFFNRRNRNINVLNNTIARAGENGIVFWTRNRNALVAGNTISDIALDGIFIDEFNSDIWVQANDIKRTGEHGIHLWNDNLNTLLANNTLTSIGGDAFHFSGGGNILIPGSVANAVTNAPVGDLCGQNSPFSFTGILTVADPNGVPQIFTDGC